MICKGLALEPGHQVLKPIVFFAKTVVPKLCIYQVIQGLHQRAIWLFQITASASMLFIVCIRISTPLPQKHQPLFLAKPPLNMQIVQVPLFRQFPSL